MGVEGPAISYLHEQGRMGRDIKVGNDPVDSYGSIKLADIGAGHVHVRDPLHSVLLTLARDLIIGFETLARSIQHDQTCKLARQGS